MEHKAVKKAKKGLFSIVFGRTALILMLVLIQLIILVGVATILNDYAVYVYGGFTVLAAVIVIYIINERGNPAFNMTWVLLILIFPAFGCLFYIWVKSQLGTRYIGKRLCMLRLDTAKYMQQEPQGIAALRESKPANAFRQCKPCALYAVSAEFSYLSEYTSAIFCMWRRKISGASGRIEEGGKIYLSGVFYCRRRIYVGVCAGNIKRKSSRGRRGTVYV